MPTQDELEYQEYLDYLEYQKLSEQGANRSPALAPREKKSLFESSGAGAAQGFTAGHTPQVVGGIASLLGKVQDAVNPVINPATGEVIPRVNYTEARDATNREIDQARQDNPKAYLGSQLAATVVGARRMGGMAGMAGIAAPATALGRIGAGAALGGAQGLAYNPGDQEGVVDPLQAGSRAKNAGIGALLGLGGSVLGEGIRKGVQVGGDLRKLKSGAMADEAKSQIDGAVDRINQNQIAPRDAQLKQLITGKPVEVNLDRVAEVFPNYARKVQEKAKAAQPQGLAIAGGPAPVAPSHVTLPGERALRLRRGLDKAADYGMSKVMEPSAVAKGETARAVANSVRRGIDAVDEGVAPIQAESSKIMRLRDALANQAKTDPIGAISKADDTSKGQLLKQVDNLAGSKLEDLGANIEHTGDLLLDPRRLFGMGVPNEVRRIATRGGVSLAEGLNKVVPAGTGAGANAFLLEAKRKNKKEPVK